MREALPRKVLGLLTTCVLAAGLCLGCDDEESITLAPLCIVLAPAAPSPPSFAVRTAAASPCNRLDVEIVAAEAVSGVFSMALSLRYPLVGVLDNTSIAAGSVWSTNPQDPLDPFTVQMITEEDPVGVLQLGITRQAPDPPFDVAAGTVLATLSIFQATGSGSGDLTFLSGQFQNAGIPPQTVGTPIPSPDGVIAGRISIVQQ